MAYDSAENAALNQSQLLVMQESPVALEEVQANDPQVQLMQEIQNRASLDIAEQDSLEHSKLPLTSGLKEKREQKQSLKKNDVILKIYKEHGIDPKARANANKLIYDIPPLDMIKKGGRTPVTQVFKELIGENE